MSGAVRLMDMSSYSPGANLMFSILMALGFVPMLGAGLEMALMGVVVIPLANLVFWKWHTGTPINRVMAISVRGLALTGVLFCAAVAFVKLSPVGGQVGYGDQLQIDGSEITGLGYQSILKTSFQISAIAWVAAVLTSISLIRR